jgi:cyclic-di-GMP-binding protein
MTKDSSFDVVSKINIQDLDNAVNNANKDISNRYDLKGTSCTIELDKSNNIVTLLADSDMQADQVMQVLFQKMTKLSLDLKSLKSKGRETVSGDKIKETFSTINGIEQDVAKKMVKDIKDLKMKVQASIQGDQLRISGKNRDDLQKAISFLKEGNYDMPLQFVNYR